MVLIIMLYKMVLAFASMDKNPSVCPFKCKKAIEQYFHVVLLIMLYKAVFNLFLPFESVDETLGCDYSN